MITHTYQITGMTCNGCKAKVQGLLSEVHGVIDAAIDLKTGKADISMDRELDFSTFQTVFKDYPKYQISMAETTASLSPPLEETKPWFVTYKPILLIFSYLLILSSFGARSILGFDWMRFMNLFMGGFFITFSFFKMLDLRGFMESYRMYDIVAKIFPIWGALYACIELSLGLAYLFHFEPLMTNIIAFLVMSISLIGVLISVFNKKKIRCACLGTVFNLPMSTVAIIEDLAMIGMSGWMLWQLQA